jgi:hypothetical protein
VFDSCCWLLGNCGDRLSAKTFFSFLLLLVTFLSRGLLLLLLCFFLSNEESWSVYVVRWERSSRAEREPAFMDLCRCTSCVDRILLTDALRSLLTVLLLCLPLEPRDFHRLSYVASSLSESCVVMSVLDPMASI